MLCLQRLPAYIHLPASVPQEARIKRVLDRAAAPAFQKTGKPVMFRSTLQQKSKQAAPVQQQLHRNEEEELRAYLELGE